MVEEQETSKVKTINIYPCKRTRRVLTFLADFFICFIAAVFLEIVVAQPISNAIIHYDELNQKFVTASENNIKLLYENKILFHGDLSDGKLNDSIKYTCEKYTEKLCKNDPNNEFDVFTNYYNLTDKNLTSLTEFYQSKATKYFDVDTSSNMVSLKQEYITLFAPKFDEKNEISEEGKKAYAKYEEEYFLTFYAEIVLHDVKENDLSFASKPELGTYKGNEQIISDFETKINEAATIDTAIVFGVTMIIFYIIVPLTNKKGATCAELIMKVERIDKTSIKYLKKYFVAAEGVINMLSNSAMLVFIPSIMLGMGPAIGLKALFEISLVGFGFMLIQLLLMCFTKLNQSLRELATHSICVDSEVMDNYFREKGYDF